MFITRTITKKILENIVQSTFLEFGSLVSSSLLDSLKLLGFFYATTAGISINIEDLRTPEEKKKVLFDANSQIDFTSQKWQQGLISDTERFQTIIDTWSSATESLKDKIIDYYQTFDPANNLYIMAFSGARGNMSQVRQLVGMRGLMSDQEGKIIDLPIQTNFREGLSSLDYIISSYGARKGIVDTALKTADSGYLTRRLIYLAQDLIIREFDCQSKEGIIVFVTKKSNTKNLVGRTLNSAHQINEKKERLPLTSISSLSSNSSFILNEKDLKIYQEYAPLQLNVRSSLTCQSHGSICQKCYGWDLAYARLISLGEAIGIIAAQSIGEPGTQLTMRTFHTGGIFSAEMVSEVIAPISGKLIIPETIKSMSKRTNHGEMLLKMDQEISLSIMSWRGEIMEVFLPKEAILFFSNSGFVKKNQKIAEYSTQTGVLPTPRLKPLYAPIDGEIKFENICINQKSKQISENGIFWIASGKIYEFPREVEYFFPTKLEKTKPFAQLKLISPIKGIVQLTKKLEPFFNPLETKQSSLKQEEEREIQSFSSVLKIVNQRKSISFDISDIVKTVKNCWLCFSPLVRQNQYIDEHTILGFLEFFPLAEGQIYSSRTEKSKDKEIYFLITESDVWKINSDQINQYSFDKKSFVRTSTLLNENSVLSRSGIFLKKDGFKLLFQNAIPFFLNKGTHLKYTKTNQFIFEKEKFAELIQFNQQNEDIVQGLPKIEELIEARKVEGKCLLADRPGICFFIPDCNMNVENYSREFEYGKDKKTAILKIKIPKILDKILVQEDETKETKKKKNTVHFITSLFTNKDLQVYDQKLYKLSTILSHFELIPKPLGRSLKAKLPEESEYILTINQKKDFFPRKEWMDNNYSEDKPDLVSFYGKKAFSRWIEADRFLFHQLSQTLRNERHFFRDFMAKFQSTEEKDLTFWWLMETESLPCLFENQKTEELISEDENKVFDIKTSKKEFFSLLSPTRNKKIKREKKKREDRDNRPYDWKTKLFPDQLQQALILPYLFNRQKGKTITTSILEESRFRFGPQISPGFGKHNFSGPFRKYLITSASSFLYNDFEIFERKRKKKIFLSFSRQIFSNTKKDYLISGNQFNKIPTYFFLEYYHPVVKYEFPIKSVLLPKAGTFLDLGEPITDGVLDIHDLLRVFFNYHSIYDGITKGIRRSMTKFQLILVHSIQAIYQSQGVNISSKHVEIIVRQMMTKVLVKERGDTPLLVGEGIRLSLMLEICKAFQKNNARVIHEVKMTNEIWKNNIARGLPPTKFSSMSVEEQKAFFEEEHFNLRQLPKYEPILLSATSSSLNKDGFLSAAGFQETKRILTKAAIEGNLDWLRGLKECIIIGRLIPAGSAFLNYKNYLDSVYLFKTSNGTRIRDKE